MKSISRALLLFSLSLCLGAEAGDATLIMAQNLPGRLPGTLPGQQPPAAAKPAAAASPAPKTEIPAACCDITAIDKAKSVVRARERAGARIVEFKVDAALLKKLQVGQDVHANFGTKQVSVDGKTMCCAITSVTAAPTIASTTLAPSAQKAPQALPGQQRLPVQPPASAPTKAATAPAPVASTGPAAPAKTPAGPSVQPVPPKPFNWVYETESPGRPAILLFHGNGNRGSAWTKPSTALENIAVMRRAFDFRHTPDTKRVGDTHDAPNAGFYKVGQSDYLDIDSKNWWAFLRKQKFTLATWDQTAPGGGPGFAAAYASAKVAFARLAYETKNAPIALIGHSRGGLLIRKLLKENPPLAGVERVRWVITLHSPHHGSDMARAWAEMLAEVVDLMDKQIPASIPGPFGNIPITAPIKAELKKVAVELFRPFDKALMDDNNRELMTDGPLVRDLALGEVALPGVKYYTFGGDNPAYVKLYVWVFDPNSAVPQYKVQTQGINTKAKQYFVWRVKAVELPGISPLLDKVRNFTPEVTPGKGDGLVTDKSARLPFSKHETTRLNHMEALYDNNLQVKVLGLLTAK